MTDYVIKKAQIDSMPGLFKTHFLNENAQRNNKSLGDLTGITSFGFHLIEVPPGKQSNEFHVHFFEDIYRNTVPGCDPVANVVEHKYISEPATGTKVEADNNPRVTTRNQ